MEIFMGHSGIKLDFSEFTEIIEKDYMDQLLYLLTSIAPIDDIILTEEDGYLSEEDLEWALEEMEEAFGRKDSEKCYGYKTEKTKTNPEDDKVKEFQAFLEKRKVKEMRSRDDLPKTEAEIKERWSIIEELAISFQSGNREDGYLLIESFTPFICKYSSLITNGLVEYNNKDIRNFISMYIGDTFCRSIVRKGKNIPLARSAANNAAALLVKTCESLSEEDLIQDMSMIILTMARRYKQKGKSNFCGYVYNVFRFELYRRLAAITKDPLTFSKGLYDYSNEEDFTNEDFLCIISPNVISLESSLDYNWCQGMTCSDIFNDLSIMERIILKFTYEDNYSDVEISRRTGLHRHTIRKKKIAILEKLDNLVDKGYNL